MKKTTKLIVILFAIFYNSNLFAQTENLAVVSADKMNVLYVGIDNPVSIAVQGITGDKIKISISNGTITGNNGKYIVKVNEGYESIIEVSAEIKPGEIKNIGSYAFRIKRIPLPSASMGIYCNNNLYLNKEDLLKNPQVTVSSNVPFDFEFHVLSYKFTYKMDGDLISKAVIGNKFSTEIIDAINKMEAGSKIFIEEIKAVGPDGTVRMLSSFMIIIAED